MISRAFVIFLTDICGWRIQSIAPANNLRQNAVALHQNSPVMYGRISVKRAMPQFRKVMIYLKIYFWFRIHGHMYAVSGGLFTSIQGDYDYMFQSIIFE
jgi:hypothetical protein